MHSAAKADDPVAALKKRLDSGQTSLTFSETLGYLPSLLNELGISPDSQLLVFSKTSFQRDPISPKTPRAIFFNDETAIGYIPGGDVMEVTSFQPGGGQRYYTIDMKKTARPTFEPENDRCLICHGRAGGLWVSSVSAQADGTPYVTDTLYDFVDHRTPFNRRWGGWFVTGSFGSSTAANSIGYDPNAPFALKKIDMKIDASRYPAPGSDIVALMTLDHQVHMTNLIASVAPLTMDDLVDYMLFLDEEPFKGPVQTSSTFRDSFTRRGPRDSKGRSLRDFDLQTRLFKYPLSYMIYSEAFQGIEPGLRARIYTRISDILTGERRRPKYDHLSAADRKNLLEILRDTIPEFPTP